jgi:fermentation-respiration switch protein FrsA (DUF1100 family)
VNLVEVSEDTCPGSGGRLTGTFVLGLKFTWNIWHVGYVRHVGRERVEVVSWFVLELNWLLRLRSRGRVLGAVVTVDTVGCEVVRLCCVKSGDIH